MITPILEQFNQQQTTQTEKRPLTEEEKIEGNFQNSYLQIMKIFGQKYLKKTI